MKKELTVKEFNILIGIFLHIWKGFIDGSIKLARSEGGYESSIVTYLEGKKTKNKLITSSNPYLH